MTEPKVLLITMPKKDFDFLESLNIQFFPDLSRGRFWKRLLLQGLYNLKGELTIKPLNAEKNEIDIENAKGNSQHVIIERYDYLMLKNKGRLYSLKPVALGRILILEQAKKLPVEG